MRSTCIAAWIVLPLLAGAAHAAEGMQHLRMESGGRSHDYTLFVPADLPPGQAVPLLLALHGSTGNVDSIAPYWAALAQREQFIIAGPGSLDSMQWTLPEDGPLFFRELMEKIAAQFPVDPRRLYLFGQSAGAMFSLRMAMMESQMYAAVAVHGGAWRTPAEYGAIKLAKRRTPIAMFIGDHDEYFPLGTVMDTRDALRRAGFPVSFTLLRGHTHSYYELKDEINEKAWAFLSQHRLESAPKYTPYNLHQDSPPS